MHHLSLLVIVNDSGQIIVKLLHGCHLSVLHVACDFVLLSPASRIPFVFIGKEGPRTSETRRQRSTAQGV